MSAGGENESAASGPVVVLVGPMGVGKSTVGALLADRLGTGYRDTDADIEVMAGRPIPEIFIDEGEAHFRELERQAVHAAVVEHSGVLSLGGGAIMDSGTRKLLAGLPVVFLDVGVNDAMKRVGLNAPRPLLAVNPRQRWRELMEERRPLYTEVARVVVRTDERTPEDVSDAVVEALDLPSARPSGHGAVAEPRPTGSDSPRTPGGDGGSGTGRTS